MRLDHRPAGMSTPRRDARAVRQFIGWRWSIIDSYPQLAGAARREVAHGWTLTAGGARRAATRAMATPALRIYW